MLTKSGWVFLIMTMLLFAAPSPAADEATATDSDKQLEVSAMVKEVVAKCRFSSGENRWLEQHPEPILRWSNPTAGSVFGDVYVWTDQGRPAVIAGAYRFFTPNWGDALETCSLAMGPVVGTKGEEKFWTPDKPGIQFQKLTDVDPPSKVAAVRLTQMRRIVDDFVAELIDTRGANSTRRRLRLLSRPVFRYPAATEKSTYIDGALFTFVEGTDPEVMMLVEATQAEGLPEWRFGIARMNRDELQVMHRDQVVWTAPYLEEVMGRTREPYALFTLRPPQ